MAPRCSLSPSSGGSQPASQYSEQAAAPDPWAGAPSCRPGSLAQPHPRVQGQVGCSEPRPSPGQGRGCSRSLLAAAPQSLLWEEAPKSKHSLMVPPSGVCHISHQPDFQSRWLSLGPLAFLRMSELHAWGILTSVILLLGCWGLPDVQQVSESAGALGPGSELFWVLKRSGERGGCQTAPGQSGGILLASGFALPGGI